MTDNSRVSSSGFQHDCRQYLPHKSRSMASKLESPTSQYDRIEAVGVDIYRGKMTLVFVQMR